MVIRSAVALLTVAVLVVALGAPAGAAVSPDVGREWNDDRPIVLSVELLDPGRHNDLLEADLTTNVVDADGLSRYEYRWNGSTHGSVQTTSISNPTVSYATIEPDSTYSLEFRAVDVYGHRSEWETVWSGMTPGTIRVVVAGDSIASGYTRTWFTGDATCRDEDLSYGSELVASIAAGLPAAWAPEYVNTAWAGAGAGAVLVGGTDSCGTRHQSQLDQIDELLDDRTWNIVAITAGINSTNWTDVIVGLTKDTAISITSSGDQKACDLALRDKWNIDDRSSDIGQSVRAIVDGLTTRTNADMYWTSYYDVTGSELAPLWTPIGSECTDEMGAAVEQLHAAVRSGLTENVTWVDVGDRITTQSWAGWPHPNASGHATIGRTVASAVAG